MSFNRVYPALLVLWLGALAAYVLAGVPLATFHGDEGMLVYTARDVLDEAAAGDVLALTTTPPYPIDSRQYLRIINGSVQRFAFGAVLLARGHNTGDLPREPGWNWGLGYDDNVEGGWLPKNSVLLASRYTSAAFFILSLIPLAGIAGHVGGRVAVFPATLLYALNPLVLLNARRAMQEGVMLCFGLLTVWVAASIAERVRSGKRVSVFGWAGLALAGGLALAAKHSAAIFLVGAWLWVGVAVLAAPRNRARALADVIFAGVWAVVIFVILSPALWNNPPARLADLARLRGELLEIQVAIEEGAPTSLGQRLEWIYTQPYTADLTHYERRGWGEAEAITTSEARYNSSSWRGYPRGMVLGVVLTAFAAFGAVVTVVRSPIAGAGLLLWYSATAAFMLVNPLPWERYYIPLIPAIAVLTACGIAALIRWSTGYGQGSDIASA